MINWSIPVPELVPGNNKTDHGKDVVEATETTASTNNEQNKDLCVTVEPDDTGGGGDGDKGPVITRFPRYRYRYQQQQKSTSDHGKGYQLLRR